MISCSRTVIQTDTEYRVIKTGDIMEMNSEKFLLRNNGWNLETTEHFKFYFDLATDPELRQETMAAQENNFQELARLMGIPLDGKDKILFYLFRDIEQKKILTLVDSDAHAISDFPAVYHLPFNSTGGQEVGHVMTQKYWGSIPKTSNYSLIIDEGFNFYIDDERFYKGALWNQALKSKKENQEITIEALILANNGEKLEGVENGSHQLDESFIAGAFVKFIIDNYGISKFEALWRSAAIDARAQSQIFDKVYGKSITEISEEFELKMKGD